ncbi:MAG: DUF86 domain-containing protein [Anaerolineales bacterium]|uniref:DUF86 domain-containing protein n=1 Tax=Candidatus Desulfolinea nitratireducens TaxID=2841698 RepID=A0A8J6TJS6_9CHLR|nr:DUF86 domain-containing protein [Candidatus Desulfolinea nitratireducens]MBL6961997.1 DUF86 domain-containing protein [Anaerolineales bacterium]
MSRHDPLIALRHMRDYARESVDLAQEKSRQDLDDNRTFNLAQARLLEIIGEAANRIPVEFQMEHPEIAWGQIVSLRNRLIHGYDAIDFDIMWLIIQSDLPELIKQLENII